jgi:hypothetical protein
MIVVKLNSKTFEKNPSSITQTKTKIQNTDRTLDGTMVVDIVAIKNVVNVEWSIMYNTDFRNLINEISNSGFCTIDYFDGDSTAELVLKNITAIPSDISYEQFYDYQTNSIIWKNVKVSFTER